MHPTGTTISDYVDGTLDAGQQEAVARHLDGCVACRRLADDLGEVRVAVAALVPRTPPLDGWSRVEQALRAEPRPARPGWTSRPYWRAAAAAALVLAAVVGYRISPFGRRAAAPPPQASPTLATGEAGLSVETEMRQAADHYEKAIKGLEQITGEERNALDPATAATLQKNLAVIDLAIGESRDALHTEPDSDPAQQSLIENFRTKVRLLQDTVALIGEMRKGSNAGAAQAGSGLTPPR